MTTDILGINFVPEKTWPISNEPTFTFTVIHESIYGYVSCHSMPLLHIFDFHVASAALLFQSLTHQKIRSIFQKVGLLYKGFALLVSLPFCSYTFTSTLTSIHQLITLLKYLFLILCRSWLASTRQWGGGAASPKETWSRRVVHEN